MFSRAVNVVGSACGTIWQSTKNAASTISGVVSESLGYHSISSQKNLDNSLLSTIKKITQYGLKWGVVVGTTQACYRWIVHNHNKLVDAFRETNGLLGAILLSELIISNLVGPAIISAEFFDRIYKLLSERKDKTKIIFPENLSQQTWLRKLQKTAIEKVSRLAKQVFPVVNIVTFIMHAIGVNTIIAIRADNQELPLSQTEMRILLSIMAIISTVTYSGIRNKILKGEETLPIAVRRKQE